MDQNGPRRDTCNLKGKLKKRRIWKNLIWKVQYENGKKEVGKFEPKLKSTAGVGN